MEIDYQQKYLKYKAKYLELKRQLGGGGKCGVKQFISCGCKIKGKVGSFSPLCKCKHGAHATTCTEKKDIICNCSIINDGNTTCTKCNHKHLLKKIVK